jgi:hypothetical protein
LHAAGSGSLDSLSSNQVEQRPNKPNILGFGFIA